MQIAIVAVTKGGHKLAEKLAAELPSARVLPKEGQKVAELLRENWARFDGFVCIMAAGIVVRSIAPLLADKREDPAIVVTDERGRHAISLLSGHIGGGNDLASKVAKILGGTPVITTASDTLGLTALDLWAESFDLRPNSREALTRASSKLVNNGTLNICSEIPVANFPDEFKLVEEPGKADLIISHHTHFADLQPGGILILHQPDLVVGIGCNRGTPEQEIAEAQEELFAELNLSPQSIRNIASIDKKNDEKGLLDFAARRGYRIDFYDSSRINSLTNLEISFAALKAVGAIGVAEPSALLSAGSNLLLCRKRKWKNVTMAVALAPCSL